jgi:hypothetical protein
MQKNIPSAFAKKKSLLTALFCRRTHISIEKQSRVISEATRMNHSGVSVEFDISKCAVKQNESWA